MGFVFSKIFSGLVGGEQMRMIIIGLDNAGKTTIFALLLRFYDPSAGRILLDASTLRARAAA